MKFDFVAGDDINQDWIFQEVAKPIADSCLEGKPGIFHFINNSFRL